MESRGRNNRNCAADLCLVRIFVLTEKTQEEEFYGYLRLKRTIVLVQLVFDQTKTEAFEMEI